VKTASTITRGFINVMNWGNRAAKPDREAKRRRDTGIAVVFMVDSSTEICLREVRCLAFATDLAASR